MCIEKNSIYRKSTGVNHVPRSCIDEWLQSNSTCPVCRLQIGNSEEEGTTNRPRRTNTFSLPIYSIRYANEKKQMKEFKKKIIK